MQQEEELQMALWKSQHDQTVAAGAVVKTSHSTFESSQEELDFALTLSASEYDATQYYDHDNNEAWESEAPAAIEAELEEPQEEGFQADWKSDSDSDGSSTFALDLESNKDCWLSSSDHYGSSSMYPGTVTGSTTESHIGNDRQVIIIDDETSPPIKKAVALLDSKIVNLLDDDDDDNDDGSSPRTPLRCIDNNRRADPPSTCRSVIRSLDDCVIDLTSDGPDSSGKKGGSIMRKDSSSPVYISPRKKYKYSGETANTTNTKTTTTVVGSTQLIDGPASSAGWSDWVGGSIRSTASLSLLVDLRERKDQDHYRSFFHSITQKCGDISSTPETRVSVVQQTLHLGDFLFAYEHDSSGQQGDDDVLLISHVLVERKSIKDIVGTSADRSGTGSASRYWKQERRMRFCSLRTPIMLIEGKIVDASVRKVRPLISKESDLEKPGM